MATLQLFSIFVQTAFSSRHGCHVFKANYFSHPFFLGFFFRLHVVMIPSYKTPVEVLRMALHARDLGRLKIWQLGNLPKKNDAFQVVMK